MANILDKGTTSIALVHEALHSARQRDIDLAPVLAIADIDPQLLDAPRARVSAASFARLWVELADLLDDEFFGIDSHPMRRGSFKLMCHALLDCSTLGQALPRMLSFLRLVLDDTHGELHVKEDQAYIVLRDQGVLRRLFAYGTWFILVHGLSCWLVNQRIPLRALSFRPPKPVDESDYRMRFCEDIQYDAPMTEARFDKKFLDMTIAQTPASLSVFLKESPASLLVKYRNDDSISAQIRRRLRGLSPDQWPERDELALLLCMSNSTLQRRLQAEGTHYQNLKDDLRRDLAIDLLSRGDLTVTEVAAETGFQETSAFHRAFKKWTGVNPGAYRRNHPDK
ncbi:AraC family transcriptional regulator [Pseudomonas fluorescens NCIMB 11764]|uniref:AraC family transcriptional regulator n=1 Tax=Pseudomonas fluorescens NCIMB 11764 TaxID=1221522 RepID=A0A0K1QX55_PSEFL|nr:AraC family transcriptional regulator [Pseudomonas fluorescens]AKV10065.1 AraC family transcriptional regulator [Pseudomonas fluorescens NCIMB 11764]